MFFSFLEATGKAGCASCSLLIVESCSNGYAKLRTQFRVGEGADALGIEDGVEEAVKAGKVIRRRGVVSRATHWPKAGRAPCSHPYDMVP
jgi:hypothetical protein